MAAARLMHAAYTALGLTITPALAVWLTKRTRRGKEDATRRHERFGFAKHPRPSGTLVWLHAASVGETQSVLTLVREMLTTHPSIHLLITTGTVTSAALVAQQNLPRTIHQFVPVDTYFSVRRFLNHWRPDIALWVESEFWPQLLWQAQTMNIPMLLVNARISEKTYENWAKWPSMIRSLLHTFCSIYAGSTEDAIRLKALGGSNIHTVGNIKFDAAPLPVNETMLQHVRSMVQGRPIVLAASTHANEEQLLAQTHGQVMQQMPSLLTIIVPRHAARGNVIANDLRTRGFTLSQRSKNEPIDASTQLYLADTMGELGLFYTLSDIVFMGGSLVAHGGQNPLEAARAHNAILTGPYTHNFASIISQLEASAAIRIVHHADQLAREILNLLRDKPTRETLAANAQKSVEQSRGASSIILQHVSELIARSAA